ncbi:MAG: hypothetical protein U5R14_09540 [Gemmatimonadota bacterium]|nr:hypothetical protein [Gemmatimonadota bacterium]
MRRLKQMKSRQHASLVAALSLTTLAACSERIPTSPENDVLPGAPVTIEIEVPWEEFGSALEVYGGYGTPGDLGTGVLANAFAGSLDARTLVRFGAYPQSASVQDTEGTTVTDTDLTVVGGRLVASIDRTDRTNDGPVTLTLGATQEAWHGRSAGWDHAVDTLGERRSWTEPGGGVVTPLDTATWDPASGDTVSFVLDSVEAAAWSDASDPDRGGRLDLVTEGHRLGVESMDLRLTVRPSVNPDTTVVLDVPRQATTFIYDPRPGPPSAGIRVGGAPAWRSVLDLEVPRELTGPAELCDAVGCPVTLSREAVSYAALVLRTRRSEEAFQPRDTVGLDVREVLSREALPKSPLGSSLIGAPGKQMPGILFREEEGAAVEIPITPFVRDRVGETASGADTGRSNTLALLSTFEPLSIAYASFHGPGSSQAPALKLVVTVGPSVELP